MNTPKPLLPPPLKISHDFSTSKPNVLKLTLTMLSEMKFKHLTIITFKFYEADIPRFRFKSARTELPFSPRGSSQPFRAPRSPLGACGDITVSPGRALTSQAHTEPRNCDLTAAGSHGGAREGGGDALLTCAGTPPPPHSPRPASSSPAAA